MTLRGLRVLRDLRAEGLDFESVKVDLLSRRLGSLFSAMNGLDRRRRTLLILGIGGFVMGNLDVNGGWGK